MAYDGALPPAFPPDFADKTLVLPLLLLARDFIMEPYDIMDLLLALIMDVPNGFILLCDSRFFTSLIRLLSSS